MNLKLKYSHGPWAVILFSLVPLLTLYSSNLSISFKIEEERNDQKETIFV